jgi:hypothetical protein
MIRTIFLASRLLLCSATAAIAQPALAGTGIGGGEARMSGSGDNVTIERIGPSRSQAGRAAMMLGGSGSGPEVLYLAPIPRSERGRSAVLMGSGENATVIDLQGLTGAPLAFG